MAKICTSIEQSKKLIELGIDINTADIIYTTFYGKISKNLPMPREAYDILKCPIDGDKCVPAWSLTALLGILPLHLIVNGDVYKFGMSKGFNKNGETYAIKYNIFNTTFYLHLTNFYNNPIEACVEMIVWLKENGKI